MSSPTGRTWPAEAASTGWRAAGLSDRFDGAAGRLLRPSVPGDGDAYVLSSILHDWTDEECVQILRVRARRDASPAPGCGSSRRCSTPTRPVRPREQADLHLVDLNMLVLFGARERSSAEYAALLTAAGFDPPVVHSPSAPWNVIESTRR